MTKTNPHFEKFKSFFEWSDSDLISDLKIGSKTLSIFDVETFKTFTCVIAIDHTGVHGFRSDRNNFTERVRQYFTQDSLIYTGFNNHSFDNTVINRLSNDTLTNFMLAQSLILEKSKKCVTLFDGFETIDLIGLRGVKELSGLKGIAAKNNTTVIQELPYPFDIDALTSDQCNNIVGYCINDVVETLRFARQKFDDMQLRYQLMRKFDMPRKLFSFFVSAKGASVAEMTIKHLYESHGEKVSRINTISDEVKVSDLMPSIFFKTEQLSTFYNEFKEIPVNAYNFIEKLKTSFRFSNLEFFIGSGGIHAAKEYQYEDDGSAILEDRDVTSYYPSLMLEYNIKPRHLSDQFLQEFAKIVSDRVAAKAAGDSFTANALKLVINSTFGKLNNASINNGEVEYASFLYDWQAMLSVTLTGQFLLLKLCEEYFLNNIEIISANTDGVMIKYTEEQADVVKKIDAEWQEWSKMNLEFTKIAVLKQRDVNNYVAKLENGKTKVKGAFAQGAGNRAEIVSEACLAYLLNNKSISDTINECNITDKFLMVVNIKQPFAASFNNEELSGHVVRYYHSTTKTPLLKVDGSRVIKVSGAESISLAIRKPNELPVDIDKSIYIQEVEKLVGVEKQLILDF